MSSLANTNAVPNRETTPVAGSHRMRFAMVHESVQEVCVPSDDRPFRAS